MQDSDLLIRPMLEAVRELLPAVRMVTLYGNKATRLGILLAGLAACDGLRPLYLCGDNCFDPYSVAALAKTREQSPENILARVLVARAFTAYQLDELVSHLDLADGYHLVVISGICTPFFDEDVTMVEAARLFYRMVGKVIDLSRAGMNLLLTQVEPVKDNGRGYFLKDLCRKSNAALRTMNGPLLITGSPVAQQMKLPY